MKYSERKISQCILTLTQICERNYFIVIYSYQKIIYRQQLLYIKIKETWQVSKSQRKALTIKLKTFELVIKENERILQWDKE